MSRRAEGVRPSPDGLSAIGYEGILRNIHDAVYTLDPNGVITWVNEVAVEEFDVGYTREELIGAPVTEILSVEDVERCADLIADMVATDPAGSRRTEIELLTKDGRAIPGDLHLALLPAEDGSFEGTLGVVRNITEQKRREQGLSVLNRVLRHNLRNELSIVLGGLSDSDESARQSARAAVDRLLRTSEKARAVERLLQEGDLEGRPVDIGALAADRAAAADRRFPDADVSCDGPEACWVEGSDRLGHVLDELVENGVIHAERDRPTVTVTVDPADGAEGGPVITVADDGPGVPREELEALEVDAESPLEHASGLGLWLVAWTVEQVGGDLSFDVNEPRGTRVMIRLPAAEPPVDAD